MLLRDTSYLLNLKSPRVFFSRPRPACPSLFSQSQGGLCHLDTECYIVGVVVVDVVVLVVGVVVVHVGVVVCVVVVVVVVCVVVAVVYST